MLQFIADCSDLFTHTFNASMGLDLFLVFAAFLVIRIGMAVFYMLYHKTQKL